MKSWYKKQLLSYFPIFLLTITVIVLLGLVVISEISRKETQKANQISAGYVSDTLARSLNEIEKSVLKELSMNGNIESFADSSSRAAPDEGLLLYTVSDSLRALTNNNALIHSVYLFRTDDEMVIHPNGKVRLDLFEDQAFIKQYQAAPKTTDVWSEIRYVKETPYSIEEPVISLIKQLPIPFGDKGFAVLNADVRVLQQYITAIADENVTYLDVVDASGQLSMASEADISIEGIELLTRIPIPNTSWTIRSGIKPGQLFAWFSLISYAWLTIGCAIIVLSIGYVLYISKRNYRPIQMMINKLESIQLKSLPDERKVDDLSFIGYALEGFIEQSKQYEKGRNESLMARRRQLFMELLEGTGTISETDWNDKIPVLHRDNTSWGMGVIVAEMNHPDEFTEGNAPEDQAVMRLALQSIVQEFLHGPFSSWCEWINGHRLGVIWRLEAEPGKSELVDKLEKAQQWIEENFNISFVFAAGTSVPDWSELSASYSTATVALGHKLTRDNLAFIQIEELENRPVSDTFSYWPQIAEIAKMFRLTHEQWRELLAHLFTDFRRSLLRDQDIYMIVETMTKLLKKEIGNGIGASETMRSAWARIDMENIIASPSTLDCLETKLTEAMNDLYQTYVSVCESNSFQAVVIEMRKYIEENFDDPDLSLKHLSDRFNMNGKNVSQIFKDAFSENFVDFLLKLRIEKAKRLLTQTNLAQQDIAQQVGYSNSITFGRMFKRMVGMTPGDYRKKHGLSL